jgi:hypothetical protein
VQFLENKFAAIVADLNAMLAQLARASLANQQIGDTTSGPAAGC